jgi:predicted DNA-binding WGR domain protein
MTTQPYNLYIERKDPTVNMARYYAVSIDITLFGEACLTRRWGRIGSAGQSMTHTFAREEDAVARFLDLVRKKCKRGYSPVAATRTASMKV